MPETRESYFDRHADKRWKNRLRYAVARGYRVTPLLIAAIRDKAPPGRQGAKKWNRPGSR